MYKFQIILLYFQDVWILRISNQKILISNIYNFLLDIYQERKYKAINLSFCNFKFFQFAQIRSAFLKKLIHFIIHFLFPNNLRFQESLAKLGTCKVQKNWYKWSKMWHFWRSRLCTDLDVHTYPYVLYWFEYTAMTWDETDCRKSYIVLQCA